MYNIIAFQCFHCFTVISDECLFPYIKDRSCFKVMSLALKDLAEKRNILWNVRKECVLLWMRSSVSVTQITEITFLGSGIMASFVSPFFAFFGGGF